MARVSRRRSPLLRITALLTMSSIAGIALAWAMSARSAMAFEASSHDMARARAALAEGLKQQQIRTLQSDGYSTGSLPSPTPPPRHGDLGHEQARPPAPVAEPVGQTRSRPGTLRLEDPVRESRAAVKTRPTLARRVPPSAATPAVRPSNETPIPLPTTLAPEKADATGQRRVLTFRPERGFVSAPTADLQRLEKPLTAVEGTPNQVVSACRDAVAAAARPYSVVSVDAASAGPARRRRGGVTAPIEMRVIYSRWVGYEARQSQVNCRIDAAGRVVSVS